VNWTKTIGQGEAPAKNREARRIEREGLGLTGGGEFGRRSLQMGGGSSRNSVGLRQNRRERKREARERSKGYL
jgi:hypothetical protein